MRASDRQLFDAKYIDGHDGIDHRFANSIGVAMLNLRKLRSTIFDDFDPIRLGIGWWDAYRSLDAKRRILISDQLWQTLSSVQDNLIEAKLHYLELIAQWELEAISLKDAVQFENGVPKVEFPTKDFPRDELPSYLAGLHIKGIFGSLTAALDCIAAGVTGVFGLKTDIRRVGYYSAKRHLRDQFGYANDFQRTLTKTLNEFETSSGPSGWIEWLFDFRNMALHRGRRISFNQLRPRPIGIINAKGEQILHTEVVPCLPRNPAVSEIESLKDGSLIPLTEPAEQSITSLIRSTFDLSELLSGYLLETWIKRRSEHGLIEQPKEQWGEIRSGDFNSFIGFHPGSLNGKLGDAVTNESMLKRMRAASLDGERISFWKESVE